MPRDAGSLISDAFHEIAVRDDAEGAMVNDVVIRLVVRRGEVRFGNSQADAICEALAQRTRGQLDAGRQPIFWVPRRAAAPLAEVLDIVERQVVAGEVQQAVEQHAAVPG